MTDRTDAKIVEIEANKQLIKRGLPKIRSELYQLGTGNKPRYKPSSKHKGYFLHIGHGGKYENENNPHVGYYKIENDGTMKRYNLGK